MTMTDKDADTKGDAKPDASTSLARREERRPRRWDPFEMFDELQEEMARFWGSTFPLMPRPLSRPLRRMSLAPTTWMPSVDVYEKDGNLVVKAELPGMKKEDIEVMMDQGGELLPHGAELRHLLPPHPAPIRRQAGADHGQLH